MKKLWLIAFIALSVLTACGTKGGSSTTSEKQVAMQNEVVKTETYEYTQEVDGVTQTIRETISYKGKKFLHLDLSITHPADEETKSTFAGLDFEVVRAQLIAMMDEQSAMQQLRAVEGVETVIDVTENYDLVFNIRVDMEVVDLDVLSQVEEFGADFAGFSKITPKAYIAGLKAAGAKLVTE